MKKAYLAITVVLLCVFLSGCGQTKRGEFDGYRAKQIMSSVFTNFTDVIEDNGLNVDESKSERTRAIMEGQQLTQDDLEEAPEKMRALAYAWGEGDLKYHIVLPGDRDRFLCSTFSATTMTAYNFSYIINLPANLIANIRTDLSIKDLGETNLQGNKFEDLAGKLVTNGTVFMYILYDLFYAFIGFILASIMLPIGFFIGLLTSPVQTFFDIIPCLLGFFKTMFYAVRNLFY